MVTENLTIAGAIYKHLDAFTGGIEEFLAATADETYESEVYENYDAEEPGYLPYRDLAPNFLGGKSY